MKRIQFKGGPLEGLEQKQIAARLEVKGESEGGILHIKAYGLAFGNIDSYGDIIMPGACDAFLASDKADRMALCYQHDFSTVIGKITDKGVDDYGMWIEADILPTTAGKDAAILLKSGAVKEFSIGYRADKYHYENRDGYSYEIRIIDALTVYEVSPVTVAANPSAVLVSAKNRDMTNHNQTSSNNKDEMTPEEIKAMRESIEKAAAEKAAAEVKAVQDKLDAAQKVIDAQKGDIDNLDKSVKSQQATIDEIKENLKKKAAATFIGAFRQAVEANKDKIDAMLQAKSGSFRLDFEYKVAQIDTTDITPIAWGTTLDSSIHAQRSLANVFYEAFAKENVNGLTFNWLEGTYTDATDYVDELAAMADSDAAVEEKTRRMAKIGAHLLVSSEVTDFFTELYNWARGEAQRKIVEFADKEILSGVGADSGAGTSPKKVYGLKTNSTAFTATGAKYADATIADVMLDAQVQAMANGYTLTHAFVSYADFANIRGLKNTTGNYLYDEATGMLGSLQIVPSVRLSAGQILFADSSIVKIKERPIWELEIVRNAKLDGWDVYVRKAIQTLVKTHDKKGVIWVASVATAISAINEA